MSKSCRCGCGTLVKGSWARGHNGGMRGKKHSPETRAKMAASHVGVPCPSEAKKTAARSASASRNLQDPALRASMASRGMLGKKHAEETKRAWKGRPSGMKGKKHKPETIERMKEARAERVIPFRDTKPERAVQKLLTDAGIPFRKHVRLPGLGRHQWDLVLDESKTVIEVDGCYWHNCPDCGYSSREGQTEHDAAQTQMAQGNGWTVLRIWEHEINTNLHNRLLDLGA